MAGETVTVDLGAHIVPASQAFYGVTIPLLALATATFAIRMSGLLKRPGEWADYAMALGFALAVADWALLIPQAFFRNNHIPYVEAIEAKKCAFLAIPVWGLAMAAIKSGVGLTLLRIQQSRLFQAFIWTNIAIVSVYGFVNVWFIMLECRPIQAAWVGEDDIGEAKCLGPGAVQLVSYIGSIISILTDILLSIAPISFLWNLNRPWRERVLVGILMGLGFIAAISSVVKIVMIEHYSETDPNLWSLTIRLSTWTTIEQLLGIIAGCAPFSKPLFQRCLEVMGWSLATTNRVGEYQVSNYQHSGTRDDFQIRVETDQNPFLSLCGDSAVELGESQRNPVDQVVFKLTEFRVQSQRIMSLGKGPDGLWKLRPGSHIGQQDWK